MARTWDEARLIADGFERVYVEHEWYSGPRAGVAGVDGEPHYFRGDDFDEGDEVDAYWVWPASGAAVALEREQWAIFVGWNARYEAGAADRDSHPGSGGVDGRYDDLGRILAPYRQMASDARCLLGELRFDDGAWYRPDGTDCWFRWRPGPVHAVDLPGER
ncbi:hypothetical protein ACGFX4_07255 [Kitasatospora sp. NPDC048365]|uniref:hypothetical protein n=1 Tax=Kitasatospora sp. NPDC048365 TaxID=3364050 RepID=UPI0037186E29